MTGQEIILDAETDRRVWDYQEPQASNITMIEHCKLLELHARALACHCECLGMNAENCQRAMLNQRPVYSDDSYLSCMNKWGLINEKGEPAI